MEKITNYQSEIEKYCGNFLHIYRFPHALTNDVYLVTTVKKKIIVKIFNHNVDLDFNKSEEYQLIKYFTIKNITPDIVIFTKNYFIMEYQEGEKLNFSMLSPHVITQMAKIVKIIHDGYYDTIINIRERNFFDTIQRYVKQISTDIKEKPVTVDTIRYCKLILDKIDEFPKELAVCHNDLNMNNFILNQENKLFILDFEYASINDKYFDIAYIKALIGSSNFNIFDKIYNLDVNNNKLFLYTILLDIFTILWCLAMLNKASATFDYLGEAERYFIALNEKMNKIV